MARALTGTDSTCGYRYVFPIRGLVTCIHQYPKDHAHYPNMRCVALRADGSWERSKAYKLIDRMGKRVIKHYLDASADTVWIYLSR